MIKIGIVAQDQPDNKFGVNMNYLDFISDFGTPIIITPVDAEIFQETFKLDALVLPGGADIRQDRYTNIPQFGVQNPNNYLEYFDTKILPDLIGKIPIFGICRGLQTLNVLFGGTLRNLYFHPYSSYDTDEVHALDYLNSKGEWVKCKTNSFHHQGIGKLADNFKVEAKFTTVIEAISDWKKKIFAVQWHPERLLDGYSIDKFSELLDMKG